MCIKLDNYQEPQDLFMDVSEDYCKIKTKYSRENYTDSCMRNNTVKYKVESRDLEATKGDRIGESKMYTEFEGKRKTNKLILLKCSE